MDIFDYIAFIVIASLIVAAALVLVYLGSLPGKIAYERGHPHAAAVRAAGWVGLATMGILWPLAFVWAFMKPRPIAVSAGGTGAGGTGAGELQTRVDVLEAEVKSLRKDKP